MWRRQCFWNKPSIRAVEGERERGEWKILAEPENRGNRIMGRASARRAPIHIIWWHIWCNLIIFQSLSLSSPRIHFHSSPCSAVRSSPPIHNRIFHFSRLRRCWRGELSLMHNTRMKLASEEEGNGITIVQLSCLMNCRKAQEQEHHSRSLFSHVIITKPLWWTTFDKITICRRSRRSSGRRTVTRLPWHQDYNSHFRIWHRELAEAEADGWESEKNSFAMVICLEAYGSLEMKLENRAQREEFNRRV